MARLLDVPAAPEPCHHDQLTGMPRPRVTCEDAAAELRRDGLIDAALTECLPFPGGTASRVAALARLGGAREAVVKVNEPPQVEAEALFLRTYAASPLLPRVRVVDRSHRFLVYDYAPGVHVRYGQDRVDTRAAMLTLVRELLSHYVPAHGPIHQRGAGPLADFLGATGEPDQGTGATGAPTGWPEFLGEHVSYRHERLAEHLPGEDLGTAERLAREPRRAESAPLYLLHGDCGAHNFLFRPGVGGGSGVGNLAAVIDPYPLAGYPIYDLAFAFVSWPNGLEPEDVLPAAEALRDSGRWRPNGDLRCILWEEVLIALYLRMGTCLVHHAQDLPSYLEAWPRWRALAT